MPGPRSQPAEPAKAAASAEFKASAILKWELSAEKQLFRVSVPSDLFGVSRVERNILY